MTTKYHRLFQLVLYTVLATLGTVSLILLFGDEDPTATMSTTRWFALKALGVALALTLWGLCRLADRHDLLD